jgi:hypothetical protein
MTEFGSPDPVDPEQLLKAFLIISNTHGPGDPDDPERLSMSATTELLDRIKSELDVKRQSAMDLFRRCRAMGNFFAVDANRVMTGVDDSQPWPAIWTAAARAFVHQAMVDGMTCDTFDRREFARALGQRESREH